MVAGALLGLTATPALADDAGLAAAVPQSRLPGAVGHVMLAPITVAVPSICADVDVLRVVAIGAAVGTCGVPGQPPPPPPPSPPVRSPAPPAPAPPAGRPRRPVPARPAALRRPRPPAPKPPASPAQTAPAPRTPAPTAAPYRPHQREEAGNPLPRRKKTMATLMFLVVISAVVAAGAGIAFVAVH